MTSAKEIYTPLAIAAAILIAGCGGGGGGSMPPVGAQPAVEATAPSAAQEATPAICWVTLYGDSILAGSKVGISPAARLRATLPPNYRIDDRSVAGGSAMVEVKRFMNEQRHRGIVVLQYGWNDWGVGRKTFGADLQEMARFAQAEGSKIVFTGILGLPEAAPDLIAQARSAFTGTPGSASADWPSVHGETVDGTHPAQGYSDALADDLGSTIKTVDCPQDGSRT